MDFGNYKMAHLNYRRALTLDGINQEARKGLFKSSIPKFIAKNYNSSPSARNIEIWLQRNKNDPHSYLLLGDLARHSKKYDSALSYYKTAVAMNPNYAHGWFKLGKLNQRQGLLDSSISMYKNASSLAPKQLCYLSALASAYEDQGLYEEMIDVRKTLASLNRYLLPNLNKLALAVRSSGDLKAALHYHTMLSTNLKVEDIFEMRGNPPPWTFGVTGQRVILDDIESISSYLNVSYLSTKFLFHWPYSEPSLPTIPDSKVQLLLNNDIVYLRQARPEFSDRIALFLEKSDLTSLDPTSSVAVPVNKKLTFNPLKTQECP